VYNGGVLSQTVAPAGGSPGTNGMTVRTSCIPEMANGEDGVSFYWGG
jgi:hypothetical protein